MTRIVIIGGGFVGQLIYTYLQALAWPAARTPDVKVYDWRKTRPAPEQETRAFGPQYLWRPLPWLPCSSFDVYTTVDGSRASAVPDRVAAYKEKVGKLQDGADWRAQFDYHMQGYAPELPPTDYITYGVTVDAIDMRTKRLWTSGAITSSEPYDWLISTIPLPALLKMVAMLDPGLESRPIHCAVHPVERTEQMSVNYISDPRTPVYRVTHRGDHLFQESLAYIRDSRRLVPGKVYRHRMTEMLLEELECEGRIKCFGRFATWNPEELAHETMEALRQWHIRI